MLDWLESFGNLIVQISSFIVAFFKNVIELVFLIFKGFGYMYTVMTYLPIQYKAVVIALVSFSVIVTVVHFGE